MSAFAPRLEMLPPTQRALWPRLSQVPPDFVLYGGTAITLRLGHRYSVDYDLFSNRSFVPAVSRQSDNLGPSIL